MSIKDFVEKIKPFYTLLLILVISSIFFALGRLSAIEDRREPLTITMNNSQEQGKNVNIDQTASVINSTQEVPASSEKNTVKNGDSGQVVGSKNGNKYHFPWCGSANSIKEENKIFFASIEEAKDAGYEPAKNCKGLW